MTKTKVYVVWQGRQPGIYRTWAECEAQVKGFAGAKFKAYPNMALAKAALADDPARHVGQTKRPAATVPDDIGHCVAVDAACSGSPGPVEYRGVRIGSGEELFRVGPITPGTNNLGEFLAIVHALALLHEKEPRTPIYSDSRNAIKWVRQRQVRSQLPRTPATEKIWALSDRALAWLETHLYTNPILKWPTEKWGENPADFGRK